MKLIYSARGFKPGENQVLVAKVIPHPSAKGQVVGGIEPPQQAAGGEAIPGQVVDGEEISLHKKLTEPLEAAICRISDVGLNPRFEPFDLQPGDTLAMYGPERVIMKKGIIGAMCFEYEVDSDTTSLPSTA